MTNSRCSAWWCVPLATQARKEMLHAASQRSISTWQSCIMAPYSKMITASHYPTYVLRSYCDEINAHRQQRGRISFKVVSVVLPLLRLCGVGVNQRTKAAPMTRSSQSSTAPTVTMAGRTPSQHRSRRPSNSITLAPQWSK